MTERDRLIELLKNNCSCINEDCKKCGCVDKCFTHREADYLLENGIIVTPVKVGDTVYHVFNNIITKYQVASIVIYRYSQRIIVLGRSQYFELSDFGETVFLTQEEAEAALKGGAKE